MPDVSNRVETSRRASPPHVRCAIYTRKSTEEGLEQDFNSLDAQREAAEAYIKSQKQLGWVPLPRQYDDGGFSGGNLDRPALQTLLQDIDSRRVDCVVVYKVDRLSRSLLDFARLMDRFDQSSVSFVSVTQQFNSTTSLGRLTLNILLSFAQFEREIIGERTKDKMAAARRRGKWVGGTPVLGYDVDPSGGRLLVNEKEARRVSEIFALYSRLHSLPEIVEELNRRRWTIKSWTSKRGRKHDGPPFQKASLRRLLTNAVYAGKVEYRGEFYPGEHTGIVDPKLWQQVNDELRSERRGRGEKHHRQKALLEGLLHCGSCNCKMIPTYSIKGTRRYRYYVCHAAREKGRTRCPTKSISANLIEESVVTKLKAALASKEKRVELEIPEPIWKEFESGDLYPLTHSLVRKISYDGPAGTVSLKVETFQELRRDEIRETD